MHTGGCWLYVYWHQSCLSYITVASVTVQLVARLQAYPWMLNAPNKSSGQVMQFFGPEGQKQLCIAFCQGMNFGSSGVVNSTMYILSEDASNAPKNIGVAYMCSTNLWVTQNPYGRRRLLLARSPGWLNQPCGELRAPLTDWRCCVYLWSV